MSQPTQPAGQKKDDLEAVRAVVDALQGFERADSERILRWAREKLGLQQETPAAPPPRAAAVATTEPEVSRTTGAASPRDIRSFLVEKNPSSDQQLAAAVAYYYRFVAPEPEKKESITPEDLVEACRSAGRSRPTVPGQTLLNAFKAGYLDRRDRGIYSVNAVGENLVAMVLPEGRDGSAAIAARRAPNRRAVRRASPRKQTKRKK